MTLHHDEAHLVDEARRGDIRSRDSLATAYMPAVRSIALRYRGLGLPVEDLVQEGSLGLLDAIGSYDAGRGATFEAYARFRIRRAVRNALTDQSRLIRLPKQIVEHRRTIERVATILKGATGRAPTDDELAAATGLSLETVVLAQGVGLTPVSLDQPVLAGGSPLEALVVDRSAVDPEAETVEHEEVQEVDDAVAALSPRQREIVNRHFGFGGDAEDIASVAASLHVSQQRARAIEREALYALRDRLEPVLTLRPAR